MCVHAVYSHLLEKYGIHKANFKQNYQHPWVILCMETGSAMTGQYTCMVGYLCLQEFIGVIYVGLGKWGIMLLYSNFFQLGYTN